MWLKQLLLPTTDTIAIINAAMETNNNIRKIINITRELQKRFFLSLPLNYSLYNFLRHY